MRCAIAAVSEGVAPGSTDCISNTAWSGLPALMAARMPGITARVVSAAGTGSGSS